MQHKLYILTGPIATGKTTALLQWVDGLQKNVQGILTPVVDGKRMLMDIATGQLMDMEAAADDTDVLTVGRFVFKQAAFEKAHTIITHATGRYLVIDEVGPLELRQQGLYHAVQHALQHGMAANIVLVVREGLVEKVIDFFALQDATVITKNGLDLLP